mmetsp:Transcript_9475/g.20134  ORF Transcript_9475/g.20134 Transcript_9475/m.20134 type:complete len:211 (+) Transcript_9475:278-910(+)
MPTSASSSWLGASARLRLPCFFSRARPSSLVLVSRWACCSSEHPARTSVGRPSWAWMRPWLCCSLASAHLLWPSGRCPWSGASCAPLGLCAIWRTAERLCQGCVPRCAFLADHCWKCSSMGPTSSRVSSAAAATSSCLQPARPPRRPAPCSPSVPCSASWPWLWCCLMRGTPSALAPPAAPRTAGEKGGRSKRRGEATGRPRPPCGIEGP